MHTNRTSRSRAEPGTRVSLDEVPLSPGLLARQNREFQGTGGTSKGNANCGFLPAFIDQTTGNVYLSRFADGTVAPLHILDGLPAGLVADRGAGGRLTAAKQGVIAGFSRDGLFYTREQAAKTVACASATPPQHS